MKTTEETKKPRIGKVTLVASVQMECPHCGGPVVTEEGGYLIHIDISHDLKCEECHAPILLPKKLR